MAAPDDDRFGFDENRNVLTEALSKLVPQAVARRALTVSVETDRQVYRVGDSVSFRVTFRNRAPVPIVVETPGRRLWGWTVDGELEGSDESRFVSDGAPGTMAFRAGEVRTVERTWHGRFRRAQREPTRWVDADPGTHELAVFLAYDGGPRASTTFDVE